MASPIDLACIGRAAVDLYGEQVGCELRDVSTFARYLGGSPANTAVGAARLGLRTAMIARVGGEPNGEFVRQALEREGVDTSQVKTDPDRLTALVFLAVRDRERFPHVFYRENCADMALAPDDVDAAFIARCRAVLVSGTHLSGESTYAACLRAVELAGAAGARIVIDIDYRPVLWGLARHAEGERRDAGSELATRRIQSLLPRADLVVGTEDEMRVAGGSTDLMTALQALRSLTSALIVVKLGPMGCAAIPGAVPQDLEDAPVVPGFAVEVFNVLGAGDAFMAGFLAAWLRDKALADCCRQGNACGALVVSRHGCAPAMPTADELDHFLGHGPATRRLRDDAALAHLHRATTRAPRAAPLYVLAFDHRAQLEAVAAASGRPTPDIAAFKALVCRAFARVAREHPGTGAIVDERHGESVLAALTSQGRWIARPVELPGSMPLAFEDGDNLGLRMRAWPAEHIAKCLVLFHPGQAASLREAQLAKVRVLAEACALTGRELLLELIPPADAHVDERTAGDSMAAFYEGGVQPDWWKLPPNPSHESWRRVDAAIERGDPFCRGVLVLGMEAGPGKLREAFSAAAGSARVRGFAVGRSIFAAAAEEWFAGRWDDARVVDEVASRYVEVIALWQEAARANHRSALRENA